MPNEPDSDLVTAPPSQIERVPPTPRQDDQLAGGRLRRGLLSIAELSSVHSRFFLGVIGVLDLFFGALAIRSPEDAIWFGALMTAVSGLFGFFVFKLDAYEKRIRLAEATWVNLTGTEYPPKPPSGLPSNCELAYHLKPLWENCLVPALRKLNFEVSPSVECELVGRTYSASFAYREGTEDPCVVAFCFLPDEFFFHGESWSRHRWFHRMCEVFVAKKPSHMCVFTDTRLIASEALHELVDMDRTKATTKVVIATRSEIESLQGRPQTAKYYLENVLSLAST